MSLYTTLTALASTTAAPTVHKVPKSGEGVKSGPIALAIILLLCIALYFLLKSMSKHLKRVRDDFPTDVSGPSSPGAVLTRPSATVLAPDAILSARADQDDVPGRESR